MKRGGRSCLYLTHHGKWRGEGVKRRGLRSKSRTSVDGVRFRRGRSAVTDKKTECESRVGGVKTLIIRTTSKGRDGRTGGEQGKGEISSLSGPPTEKGLGEGQSGGAETILEVPRSPIEVGEKMEKVGF